MRRFHAQIAADFAYGEIGYLGMPGNRGFFGGDWVLEYRVFAALAGQDAALLGQMLD